MPQTKHKLFKIPISEDSKYTFDQSVQNEINNFLAKSNNIYVHHSISILSESSEKYDIPKSINKYIILSLVYKDLEASALNLEKASPKIKRIISNSIEEGTPIEAPNIQSDFDKYIKKLLDA